jgi:crossover junction endodeoxyribonuclease RusA
MTEWTIDLPYINPPLSGNDRMHWAETNTWRQQIKRDVAWLARSVDLPKDLPRVVVVLHWQPSLRRRRDSDNLYPTLKPCLDGLVAYGLTADDDAEHVLSGTAVEPVAAVSRLWLTITEAAA